MGKKKKDNKELFQINYRIGYIKLLDFSLNQPEDVSTAEDVIFTLEYGLEIDANASGIKISCSITYHHKETEEVYSHIRVLMLFEIEDLKSHYLKDNDAYDIPDEFIVTLNSIATSTLRGVGFTMLRGTFLEKYILPLIPTSELGME